LRGILLVRGEQDDFLVLNLWLIKTAWRVVDAGRGRAMSSAWRDTRGSSAVEFAIVFPVFFLVLYGIVTFSLIFVAQQTLTLAAEEGARAALRYQASATSVPQSLTLRAQAACLAAAAPANWLASAAPCSTTLAPCSYDTTLQCLQVSLAYNYATRPLVPNLPLLGLVLPATLTARAQVQLNPDNLL
jgi:Flp pilus assembly protein TadG